MPNKPYSILFLMDPYATLNLKTETSLLMMGEFLKRGHRVFWCEMEDLSLKMNRLTIRTQELLEVHPFRLAPPQKSSPEEFQALFIRKDPPFDVNYLQLTLLLDHLPTGLIQFNPARALRHWNEKLIALKWPHLAPPTLTTMNLEALQEFLAEQGEIVIKPLEDCSGRGIERVKTGDPDAANKMAASLEEGNGKKRFVTAQRFLPEIAQGDKRVYLVNGKPLGIVNRVPRAGHFLGNIHQGASCERAELTPKEAAMIEEIAPTLRAEGLFLVGLDIIGERITEINITSPSAIRQINEVWGSNLEVPLVDAILERISQG